MDREALVSAVELLAQTRAHMTLVTQLNDIIANWETRPMVFAGRLSCLNAMIDLGLTNPPAYQRLLQLAATKRKTMPDRKRVDYQRQFMRDRRARLSKALQLEEIVRGRPLGREERIVYQRNMMKQWLKQRDEYIVKHNALSYKARHEAGAKFWESIDHALEHELEEAKRVLNGYRPRRTVKVEPKQPRNPQMYIALKKAQQETRKR